MDLFEAKRLKMLEDENTQLKRFLVFEVRMMCCQTSKMPSKDSGKVWRAAFSLMMSRDS